MVKKFMGMTSLATLLLVTGCTPSTDEGTEVLQTEEESRKSVIISDVQIDDNYYKTLLPYEESASRGLVVSNMATKYDMKEVENGLLRLSQNQFSPDNYFFQEGQYLSKETISSWLARSNQTKDGLNPDDMGLTGEEKAKKAPVYVTHIVEQNYLQRVDDTVRLAGISIGVSLNSIYYYTKEDYGATYEEKLSDEQRKENGQKIANEIVSRMRAMEGLEDIPIVVGLFKQNSRNAIVPGTYFSYGVATGSGISEWEEIDEEYVLFPTSDAEEKYRDINTMFKHFKQDIDEYFSNYTSVIGTGFFKDQGLQELTINIPIQFYGSSEVISFTQYVAGLIPAHFNKEMNVEVQINSLDGAEALLIKKSGEEEPFVHIYTQ